MPARSGDRRIASGIRPAGPFEVLDSRWITERRATIRPVPGFQATDRLPVGCAGVDLGGGLDRYQLALDHGRGGSFGLDGRRQARLGNATGRSAGPIKEDGHGMSVRDPVLEEISEKDDRYPYEAYEFVTETIKYLDQKLQRSKRTGHRPTSPRAICVWGAANWLELVWPPGGCGVCVLGHSLNP